MSVTRQDPNFFYDPEGYVLFFENGSRVPAGDHELRVTELPGIRGRWKRCIVVGNDEIQVFRKYERKTNLVYGDGSAVPKDRYENFHKLDGKNIWYSDEEKREGFPKRIYKKAKDTFLYFENGDLVKEEDKNKGFMIERSPEDHKIFLRFIYDDKAQGWQRVYAKKQLPRDVSSKITNQVSEPIKTSKGFVVFKVIEIKEPVMQSYDAVKDKVRETYVRQAAEEKFAELRDRLADTTYEHPDSLRLASKKLNLPISVSELFTKEKGGNDISQYKKVRDTAFSDDVLNLQNNSDIIQLNPETVIVLRVKSHIAPSLLPLNSVASQIENKLKVEEAEARTAKFAEDLQKQLQSGGNAQQFIQPYQLTWNSTGFIGRYSTKVDSAILDLAFRLPNPSKVKAKVTYGITRLPHGYAIVALKAVKDGVVDDKKQYTIFAEQVQNSEGLLEYELYKLSQSSKAKIKILQQA